MRGSLGAFGLPGIEADYPFSHGLHGCSSQMPAKTPWVPSLLDKLLLVLVVAGPMLLLGGAVYLAVRRAGRGLGQRLDVAFGSDRNFVLLALGAGSVQLFLFAQYLSDNGWAWQTMLSSMAGVLWVALAVHRMRAGPRRGRG